MSNQSCQLFFDVQMAPLCLVGLIQPVHGIQLGLWAPGHLLLQLPYEHSFNLSFRGLYKDACLIQLWFTFNHGKYSEYSLWIWLAHAYMDMYITAALNAHRHTCATNDSRPPSTLTSLKFWKAEVCMHAHSYSWTFTNRAQIWTNRSARIWTLNLWANKS